MSDNRNNEAPFDETGETPASEVANPDATDAAAESGLETARMEAAQLKDQLLRKIAEFENFKRRTREEKDVLMKYGAEGVLLDLLPVLDDFERSLAASREHADFDALSKGVDIIYAKLLRVLENRGLRPIDAAGKRFDVDFHHALMQIPSADVEPGTVLDVAEKGYMLHDKVIRHAKVTVSSDAGTQSTEADA